MQLEILRNRSVGGGVSGQLSAGRAGRFRLHMAPMIDMIFLLLIFFLVAAKWRPQEDFLPFRLPRAEAGIQRIGGAEALAIHIFRTEAGCGVRIGELATVQIDDAAIESGLAELMEKIKGVMVSQKRFVSDPVEIVCDAGVRWEYPAKIYNIFFGAGLSDITFRMTE